MGNKDVEQKVQALIVELDARWNSRDAERFSRLFTVDHDFRIYGQRHHRSREALRDRYAQAWPELRELAELLADPVTTSLEGKSAFPETHPLSLGSGRRAAFATRAASTRCERSALAWRWWMARFWSESPTRRRAVVLRNGEWLFDAFRVTPQPIPSR